ncbi:hypothetical protein HAT2_00171 [Candidatus Similichlamydia laticola]|uniref:Uncharacterized protein n=2 Tax=Candidatus Similichlamydia laticola TaxID=2170265 RepID=A0A369KB06_9BACT|nr:hypothetical protein HAT2_00171 [Candidatus Similichlamydia laticola]
MSISHFLFNLHGLIFFRTLLECKNCLNEQEISQLREKGAIYPFKREKKYLAMKLVFHGTQALFALFQFFILLFDVFQFLAKHFPKAVLITVSSYKESMRPLGIALYLNTFSITVPNFLSNLKRAHRLNKIVKSFKDNTATEVEEKNLRHLLVEIAKYNSELLQEIAETEERLQELLKDDPGQVARKVERSNDLQLVRLARQVVSALITPIHLLFICVWPSLSPFFILLQWTLVIMQTIALYIVKKILPPP